MEIKIALLSVHVALFIFIITRPVIRKPKQIFGKSPIERDENTLTVLDYDNFSNNSVFFRKFYVSSLFIKFVFISFIVSVVIFLFTIIGDVVSVSSPTAITEWTKKPSPFYLSIKETNSGKVVADGPVDATFVITAAGNVYRVKELDKMAAFVMLGEAGPTIINTKNTGDFFGVIALFLAIACVVLWSLNKETDTDVPQADQA